MRSGGVWIHFGVLIAAIVVMNAVRDPRSVPSLLYAWMPLLAGVAVGIRPANRQSIASCLALALIAALSMAVLDVGGSFQESSPATTAVVIGGQVQQGTLDDGLHVSWVRTAIQWTRGELDGAEERNPPYSPGDPRWKALEALTEFALLLLCFATTGIVVGVSAWLSRHAHFDSSANEAGARIAVAWLVSAAVIFVAAGAFRDQRYLALFGRAPLWSVLTPSLAFVALGAAGFAWAARSGRSDPEDVA